jgi:precorrin-6A/cobalt-precorrin-6A reductase
VSGAVLILGGTGEARELAGRIAGRRVVSSLAGRVRDPALPAGEVRIGGFGGPGPLADWLRDEGIGAVIDATHPFAARITANAVEATTAVGVPLLVLRRPGWTEAPGDRWHRVPSLGAAAEAVRGLGRERVLLSIGRQGVAAFAGCVRQWFLVRAIEPPGPPLPPSMRLLLDRGPFTVAGELDLLRQYQIDVVVTKDSGGDATVAKLVAARSLGLPAVLVDRPPLPPGVAVVADVDAAVAWLAGPTSARLPPGQCQDRDRAR